MTEDTADTSAPVDSTTEDGDTAAEDGARDGAGDVADARPEAGDASCTSGTIEEEPCGKCGVRRRLCDMSRWLEWGACGSETGSCSPGDTRTASCDRCGTRTETCSAMCVWTPGICADQKACVAGTSETRYSCTFDAGPDGGSDASGDAGVQTRTCTDTCTWTDWSACP